MDTFGVNFSRFQLSQAYIYNKNRREGISAINMVFNDVAAAAVDSRTGRFISDGDSATTL